MPMNETYPFYLANKPVTTNADLDVINKFTLEVARRVGLADDNAIDQVIEDMTERRLMVLNRVGERIS